MKSHKVYLKSRCCSIFNTLYSRSRKKCHNLPVHCYCGNRTLCLCLPHCLSLFWMFLQLLRYRPSVLTLSLLEWFDSEISEINVQISEMPPSDLYRPWCSVHSIWLSVLRSILFAFCLCYLVGHLECLLYNAWPVRNIVASIFPGNAVRWALFAAVVS